MRKNAAYLNNVNVLLQYNRQYGLVDVYSGKSNDDRVRRTLSETAEYSEVKHKYNTRLSKSVLFIQDYFTQIKLNYMRCSIVLWCQI